MNTRSKAGEEGAGDVGDDEADSFGGSVYEALSDGVGTVSHLMGQGGYPSAGSGADAVFAVESAGDGGTGDAGSGGDVFDGGDHSG